MREKEGSNDIWEMQGAQKMPIPIHSGLLKWWSVFLELSCRMKNSEINKEGRDEDLASSFYSDHSGRVVALVGNGKSYI